jgi:hypothetical protein
LEVLNWQGIQNPNAPTLTDTIADGTKASGGNAILRIAYSDGKEGILGIGCSQADSIAGIQEGVIATKGYLTYWSAEAPTAGVDGDRTLFHAELSFVARFLQQQVDRQANNKAAATSAPSIHEGECAGESGRPEGGGVANGVDGPGTAKRKRRDGKRPLEQSNPLKFQIYDHIRQAHMRGENYVDTVTRLKEDKDFMEQVEEAGEKVDTKLVRKALALFDQRARDRARKQQETDPT